MHIGAGVGYYTAIIAHMVGSGGRVTAIEHDPGLAEPLSVNFAGQPNVRTVQGDGTKIDFDPADVIYVNAGVMRPVDLWLNRLKDGGRMTLALTRDEDTGGAWFLIERRGEEFLAKWISAANYRFCRSLTQRPVCGPAEGAVKHRAGDDNGGQYRRKDKHQNQRDAAHQPVHDGEHEFRCNCLQDRFLRAKP